MSTIVRLTLLTLTGISCQLLNLTPVHSMEQIGDSRHEEKIVDFKTVGIQNKEMCNDDKCGGPAGGTTGGGSRYKNFVSQEIIKEN